ncbi:MAG: CBS domain-containing protein [Caldilineales bacterium]|nr:CBS domain-containing protein [Caldilineales bacterium]
MSLPEPIQLNRKDFVSDQAVRWCPGCGDYAILAQMQKLMPELGIPREKIVFISGIGCSSRFPYYMNTYGVHSIHGRAPTLATGLKVANPDLNIWVVTGDGDGLSIGGNHMVHACRRNVDINIVLFNNRIYGLTKGQYSPTSPQGIRTKSSPLGSIEQPLNPVSVALASEATFIARTVDVIQKHMGDVLLAAAQHKGVSFVEVFQNCLIFNDGAWNKFSDRKIRDDNNLYLEDGKPMVFGANDDKGLIMTKSGFQVVELGDDYGVEDLVVHDTSDINAAWMLSRLEYPMPMGVMLDIDRPTYAEALWAQVEAAKQRRGDGDLRTLFNAADTWVVPEKQNGAPIEVDIKGEIELNLDEEYTDEILQGFVSVEDLDEQVAQMALIDLHPHAPITISPSTRMDTAISLMREHNIGCLVVTGPDHHLDGIITEGDVLDRLAGQVRDLHGVTVSQYMTKRPTALSIDAPLIEALHLMSVHGFRHLPLVDDHNMPVGVISVRDVVNYLAERI